MDIKEIERVYINAKTNKDISLSISGFGALSLLPFTPVNPVIAGILLGGGFVYWVACHARSTEMLRSWIAYVT